MENAALENSFLEDLISNKVEVYVYLVSGIKLHGRIDAHDEHVIILKNAVSQAVYKHAVSTIVPMRVSN